MSTTGDFGTGTTTEAAAPGLEKLTGDSAITRARTTRLYFGERMIGPALGIACLVVVGVMLTSGSYLSTIFEDILIFAIAAMGVDFLGGYGGLISLAPAGFLGIGAYGVAIAEVHGFNAWESVVIALAVVLGMSLITGVVAVRVSGITFVIVTLAIGQIFWGLTYQWTSLTAGDNGITLISAPYIGPWSLSSTMVIWTTTLIVFLVILGVLLVMVRSPFGLSLRGMRINEPRLRALGYRTGYQRYIGHVISVFVAGLAGVLYVFSNHLVSPANLTFSQDGFIVLMVILGGLGTIWGPCIGAVIVVMFQQEISTYVTRWETVMGLVFIAAVIFTPGGVAGLVHKAQFFVHRGIVGLRGGRDGSASAEATGAAVAPGAGRAILGAGTRRPTTTGGDRVPTGGDPAKAVTAPATGTGAGKSEG
ncbi:MAG: branched-chain amino acid ABC transporter permease [Acidimicrobiales bacterium]